MAPPPFSLATRTAVGLVRKQNEDALFVAAGRGVFAVADGMGGGAEGARASRMICDALAEALDATPRQDTARAVDAAAQRANREILDYARKNGHRQMGSTLALVALDGPGRIRVAHVGDSRVYRLRSAAVEPLTRDHSVGAELERSVGASLGAAYSARSNPLAHILTRAIGTEPRVAVDWLETDAAPKDRYLVCSDGVHDVVSPEELARLVGEVPLETAARALEKFILARGAPDNYSFIIIEIGDLP